MTEILRVAEESEAFGHFRVPQYQVKVEGINLPQDVLRDVIQLTYKDNNKDIDGFDLLVNNWDADASRRVFKYVGAEDAASLQDSSELHNLHRLFEPSKQTFEIKMGYMDNLCTMMKGHCTTMEPNFPASGGSTLSGRGLNVLHKLRRKQYSTPFCNMKPSRIAREISRLTDEQTNEDRFPIPIDINPNAMNSEGEIEFISQHNQYDIDFLFQLARRFGYVVTTPPDQSRLYFGPSTGDSPQPLRVVKYLLKRGATLVDFKPTLNAANQVCSVTVRGLNRATGRRIRETVSLGDPDIPINRDLLPILNACDPREEEVVNATVASEAEAHARALVVLMERFKEFVTATGTSIGLPDLRAGMQVQIEGVGSRFSGTYFVVDTTHTINDSGYYTKFTARREDPGGGTGTG